ncbi:LPS export ABC transporter periplasmic protein LptC [Chitinophaga sp. GCM10012297]|uniref:LPS export ABC transporter periplasmic protein LptC n=1 Tax=Chitinophaga chungangae TaxID=2821488 RepID=A0ABS3YEN2_9BACT|nr:LPS export ABC transporter periplasmic protein LptC [Chitinophaga chungangae]MBO9153147.1 LPS export ABC transporter periplasmic protein LptC [Chitinophaga chungangae]
MKRIFIYLGIALAFISCENDVNAVRAFDIKKLGVEQAYDIETIMSQTAHVKGVLTAPYMERHLNNPPHTDFPRGLQVVFYTDSLTKESILTSKFGTYEENSTDIYLRDSVVFISLTTAQRLDCKDLRWDSKQNLFVTDRFCRLSTPVDTLYGQGFRANQDFSRSEFINAYGSFAPQDSTLSFQ